MSHDYASVGKLGPVRDRDLEVIAGRLALSGGTPAAIRSALRRLFSVRQRQEFLKAIGIVALEFDHRCGKRALELLLTGRTKCAPRQREAREDADRPPSEDPGDESLAHSVEDEIHDPRVGPAPATTRAAELSVRRRYGGTERRESNVGAVPLVRSRRTAVGNRATRGCINAIWPAAAYPQHRIDRPSYTESRLRSYRA